MKKGYKTRIQLIEELDAVRREIKDLQSQIRKYEKSKRN